MSSEIRLVAAVVADAAALSTAGERLFVQAYGRYSPANDLAAHVREYFGPETVAAELQNPDVRYTIAWGGDAIAGFIKMRSGDAPETIPAGDTLEVQQLYVDAAWQRKGVGRVLMDWAVAAAREQGRAGLWLSVWTVGVFFLGMQVWKSWRSGSYVMGTIMTLFFIPFLGGEIGGAIGLGGPKR